MTTITREQAQKIIDAADNVITALAGTNDDFHPDNSEKMCGLWDDLNDRYAPPEVVRELARAMLASMDAEPAGYHVIKECGKVGCSVATLEEAEKTRDFWNKKWTIRPYFYTAQPAPVVPEKLPCSVELKPGLIIGKGCKTETLLTALRRRADYYAKIDAFTPEERAEHDASIEAFKAMLSQPAPVVLTDEQREQLRQMDDEIVAELESEEIACRAAMLQGAEPVSQTYNLPELIEGMEVSIDVSTCDADAGNRYFGTVTEVSELDTAKNGYILLVQDAKPNFDVNGNSPVIPEGYALVPIEATEEMLQASYRESSVYSPSAYRAMIAAAPQQEEK